MRKTAFSGFTLMELMVVLVIVGILFGSGFFYMTGYLPKQRLNTTANFVTNLLKVTQSKTITEGKKHGVLFKKDSSDVYYACAFRDDNNDLQCTDCTTCSDCNCGEALNNGSVTFNRRLFLLNCTTPTDDVLPAANNFDTIDFDIKGFAYRKTGVLQNFEIFIKSAEVGGTMAVKEVEVNSGGVIQLVKGGTAGNVVGQANATGCQ